jgi:iron complex transport system ATP-binding protein
MPVISVQDLNLSRQGKPILSDLNFEIDKDEHLAIIGPNGAGKSFLTRVLSLDLAPNYGSQVEILGGGFGKSNLNELRKKIGFVSSKQADWFKDSVSIFKNYLGTLDKDYNNYEFKNEGFGTGVNTCLEIVCTGFFGTFGISGKLDLEKLQKAKNLLAEFGITSGSKISFQTPFEGLSDGEKRKVLLARSLATDPEVLVFDEPCQGLDIPSRERFLYEIQKQSEKKLIVYVTHHLEELPECIQKVLLIKEGKVFKFGQRNEVLTSQNLSELFDMSLKVEKSGEKFRVGLG